jgi:phosphoglucomutase/phosphomannomutase
MLADLPVQAVEDWRDEQGRFGPLKGATDAASRNVLAFTFGPSARLVIRPSGTEPKAKVYIEVCTGPKAPHQDESAWKEQCRLADQQASRLGDEFVQLALARSKNNGAS